MLENILEQYPSKAAFCREVGIAGQYLTQIENGKRPIPPKMARFLFKRHGVPLSETRPDIFGNSEDMSS